MTEPDVRDGARPARLQAVADRDACPASESAAAGSAHWLLTDPRRVASTQEAAIAAGRVISEWTLRSLAFVVADSREPSTASPEA